MVVATPVVQFDGGGLVVGVLAPPAGVTVTEDPEVGTPEGCGCCDVVRRLEGGITLTEPKANCEGTEEMPLVWPGDPVVCGIVDTVLPASVAIV